MTTSEQRRQRVANGSRRKRDLKAVGPKLGLSLAGYDMALEWAKENLPQENAPFAAMAAMVYGSLNHGRWPTPERVVGRLKFQGKDAASLVAKQDTPR